MDYDKELEKIEKQINEFDNVDPLGQAQGEANMNADAQTVGVDVVVENTMTHSHSQDD